jgi:hypothetical protein
MATASQPDIGPRGAGRRWSAGPGSLGHAQVSTTPSSSQRLGRRLLCDVSGILRAGPTVILNKRFLCLDLMLPTRTTRGQTADGLA